MASRYWVGTTATWDATVGTKWATTSGGAGGASVPTAADDVYFDASSTGTCTLSSTSVARSIDCTGFTSIISHPAATTLNIGHSTAGAGNIALKLVAGMTYTKGNADTAALSFVSTSATQQTIDTGGKTIGNLTINGVGSSYQLAAVLTQASTSTSTFTNGTFSTNNNTVTLGTTGLGVGTKTLSLGSSTVNIIGASLNLNTNSAGLTFTAGTSSIIFNPTAAVTPGFSAGTQTYYDVSVIKSAGGFAPSGSPTFHNMTQDNTVLGGGNRLLQFDSGGTITITGTLTYKSNNASSSRGRFKSNTAGLAVTIALGATGITDMTHIDFEDIALTGTNLPVADTVTKRFADGGGNSGITFQSPVTYYWVGNGGNMTNAGQYSTSSGGSAGTVIPLLHDVVVFDSNSITSAGQTIVNDLMRSYGLDFTNVLNSPVYNPKNPNGAANSVYGSLILKSGMTISAAGAAGGTIGHAFSGRGSHTLKLGGNSWLNTMTLSAPGGTYTLGDDFTINNTGASLGVSIGTFDANGYNVSVGIFSSSNANVRSIIMGTGTWTLTGSATTIWNTITTTSLTLSPGTIVCNYSGPTGTRTFAQGNSINVGDVYVTGGSDQFQTNTTNGFFRNLDFTGFTGVWNIGSNSISKSLVLGSGMTTTVGTNTLTFIATTSETITSNGVSIASHVTFSGVGGTWTLQDDFMMSNATKTLTLTAGTLNANNKNVTTGLFSSSNSNARTLAMGTGTWTLSGTGAVWSTSTDTNMMLNAGTSTVAITDTSAAGKSLARAASQSFYDVTVTGGSGTVSFTNATTSTMHNLSVTTPPALIRFNSPATYIFTGSTFPSGTSGNIVTIDTNNAGTPATLSKSSGVISSDYLSIKDSAATGGASWYAGSNSINNGGNSGWNFTPVTTFVPQIIFA